MDSRTQKGYARLLQDLQLVDRSDELLTAYERAKASIDELEYLIKKLEQQDDATREP